MASSKTSTLDLQISDPVSMLNEITRRYEPTERILMEYVDNALDDAETLYRDNNGAYPYPIHIYVTINFGAYIAATVSIHYKDQFYAKYGYMPDRRDLLFDEQVDFIFRL